jgi:hypothetical protein
MLLKYWKLSFLVLGIVVLCYVLPANWEKWKRRSTDAKRVIDVQTMKLKEGTIQPGDHLHLDQYKSALLGCLPHTMGREKSSLKYSGGLIAVDASSGKVFV